MSTADPTGAEPTDEDRKKVRYPFERHTPEYRGRFEEIAGEMHARCPVAWSDTYGGHWVAAGNQEVFDLARSAEYLSNDHDVKGERRGYQGISIPPPTRAGRGGFLEMDPPEQRHYRQALNPYLSPAAIARWIPVIDELVRACLDERIESGTIDFVDDLANIVPAAFTLAMMGIPLKKWTIYNEPAHAAIYTPPHSPDMPRVAELHGAMVRDLFGQLLEIKANPRPGLVDALVHAEINGASPTDEDLIGVLSLLIGGGFDTTTALTAHALEWLSEHPGERDRLSRERDTLLNSATEEFLRFYTPAVGDGRTISADCEIAGTRFKEGDRLWLSWAMANRDPKAFPDPNSVDIARSGNRHNSFGLGIHRCIGSNVARTVFKRMIVQVLDRMPDFRCDPAGAVHYETIGVINGMQHLPAVFTPGERIGAGLDETLDALQRVCDEQRLAEPVTVHRSRAKLAE
ncbi:cytochrome P450 [Actinomadura parmotrematis]|uniref:Cytochrome P450 n=1 Tax=Actinomadura parmotrematis TaxID=2864039 RepID=A0ABS7FRT5_9ACTN|nr:cytochrome P450 [Actinomadura parmotrematis]MBW8482685.1 cytochrome P450 [Actinomadura parmotrematis]